MLLRKRLQLLALQWNQSGAVPLVSSAAQRPSTSTRAQQGAQQVSMHMTPDMVSLLLVGQKRATVDSLTKRITTLERELGVAGKRDKGWADPGDVAFKAAVEELKRQKIAM